MIFPDNYLRFDIDMFWIINGTRSQSLNLLSDFAGFAGNWWAAIPAVMLIILFKTSSRQKIHAVIFTICAMSLSLFANNLVKSIAGRPGPAVFFAEQRQMALENGANLQDSPGPASIIPYLSESIGKYNSFPSEKSNTVFAAATIVSLIVGGLWSAAFLAALAVAYSQVYSGAAFPLDVLSGGLCGVISICILFFMYEHFLCSFSKSVSLSANNH
jgi:membrane-associated phospholipid phosphatase